MVGSGGVETSEQEVRLRDSAERGKGAFRKSARNRADSVFCSQQFGAHLEEKPLKLIEKCGNQISALLHSHQQE